MNKNLFKALAFGSLVGLTATPALTSCSNDDTVTDNGNGDLVFNGNQIGNGDNEFVFTGKRTLTKGTYHLKGWVYVAAGSELTIEPGTVIKGDKETKAALIVEPGGKLYARGTASQPIVFTSEAAPGQRKAGDWGGVIICGKAQNNAGTKKIEGGPRTEFGGNDNADNSGVLSYVRIEFAGYPFQPDQEINGLTLGSVGSGTQIDHVQVSYSNDDSFEWFGGSVNCKYLIAYRGWDDDFDTDNGYSGSVQYGLAVRDPHIADKSQSNGFESDNDADGSTSAPVTSATFSNITFIGPKAEAGNAFLNEKGQDITGGDIYPNNGSELGKFQAAMQIRRGSRLNCINSVAIGWPVGLILDGEKGDTREQADNGGLRLTNLWFADMTATGTDANKEYDDVRIDYVTGADGKRTAVKDNTQQSFSATFFLKAQNHNTVRTLSELNLTGANTYTGLNVNFMPAPGSPLTANAASFDGISSSWFDHVSFAGAFDTGDASWLDGWTNFDPQHTVYE